jgi:hypothetical protein
MIQRRTQVNSKKSTLEKSSDFDYQKQETIVSSFTSMKDVQAPGKHQNFLPFSGQYVLVFLDPNPELFIGHSSDINQRVANSYPTHNQFCSSTRRRFDKINHFLDA